MVLVTVPTVAGKDRSKAVMRAAVELVLLSGKRGAMELTVASKVVDVEVE